MTLSPAILAELRTRLEAERDQLQERLAEIGSQSHDNPNEYTTTFPDHGDKQEENATEVSDFQDSLSLERSLESQLTQVNRALARMDDGTYGIDEVTGEPIPEARLRAMPSATSNVRTSAEPTGS